MAATRDGDLDMETLRKRLSVRFPNLHVLPGPDGPIIRGTFAIEHENVELDRFAIEIALKPVSEGDLPVVFETDGRVPRTAERHVNSNGSACVCMPEDYFLRHPGEFDVIAFLDGPVRDFFVGQSLVERGGSWPHGEWGHGNAGKEEWAKAFIGDLPPAKFRSYLGVLAMEELKGHVSCPCESGRRVRDCHLALLRLLRAQVSRATARKMIQQARRLPSPSSA